MLFESRKYQTFKSFIIFCMEKVAPSIPAGSHYKLNSRRNFTFTKCPFKHNKEIFLHFESSNFLRLGNERAKFPFPVDRENSPLRLVESNLLAQCFAEILSPFFINCCNFPGAKEEILWGINIEHCCKRE